MNRPADNSRSVLRRSIRVPLRVPVTILLPNRSEFDAETVAVSRYGAKVRVGPYVRSLICGDHVRVCHRSASMVRKARIAWIDSDGFCGLEIDDPENFWGVYFPAPKQQADISPPPAWSPIAARRRA